MRDFELMGVVDKHGVPIQKPWGWFSSLGVVRRAPEKRCDHGDQKHSSVDGPELAATAVYPPSLCKAFARALLQHQSSELLCATQGSVDSVFAADSPEEREDAPGSVDGPSGDQEAVVVESDEAPN